MSRHLWQTNPEIPQHADIWFWGGAAVIAILIIALIVLLVRYLTKKNKDNK